MAILRTIVEQKKKEVALLPTVPMGKRVPRKGFIAALLRNDRPSIIAEVKPKSPSEGTIIKQGDISKIVRIYNDHADAISVLCDAKFFGGGFDLLKRVRTHTSKPILAKEFIIDDRQIRMAAACGADAILLIAAILSADQLIAFARTAASLHLGIILEVHSRKEITKAAQAFKKLSSSVQKKILIGINNRDLDTLSINLNVTEQLEPIIRREIPTVRGIVSESGIRSAKDIDRLRKHAQVFLVGTSILRSKHPSELLSALSTEKTKVKFCGVTNRSDAKAAEKCNPDYLGFIFVPSSPRKIVLADAKKIRREIRNASVVGVFGDMETADIQKHVAELRLDCVQLHGKPDLALCKKFDVPVIQAFRGLPTVPTLKKFLKVCKYVLIDKENGKDEADFGKIAKLPADIRSRLFLAGGLQPSNVQKAVQAVRPFAVDCARGIEFSPGKKDVRRMSSFVTNLAS